MQSWSPRSPLASRRGVLTMAAGAVAGPRLGLSAVTRARQARPATQQSVITLRFQPNVQGINFNRTAATLFQNYVDANFNQKGLRAVVDPGGWGNPTQQIAAALAGAPFDDVIESDGNYLAGTLDSGWVLPLNSYMQRDNIAPTLWSAGHMAALNVAGTQYALPSYDGPAVVSYRQDILDQLGIRYPTSDWSYTDALKVWRQASGSTSAGWRYGMVMPDSTWMNSEHFQVWVYGWGGQIANGTLDQCLLNSPQAAAGIAFPLMLRSEKLVNPGSETSTLANGSSVFSFTGSWDVYDLATQLIGLKWDILPVPVWPKGRATFNNSDFYAINRASKHPDQAWELLKFLTADPGWQRMQMRVTLVTPCLLSLWDEWEAIVQTYAPPLRGKGLHWYRDAALGGYNYCGMNFRYAPTAAGGIINSWLGKAMAGQVSAQLAVEQMARQINVLEQQGAQESSTEGRLAAVYTQYLAEARASTSPITVKSPPFNGSGTDAVVKPQLVSVNTAAGTIAVQGAGGVDVSDNGSNDACTFAAAPWTSSVGDFHCRLVALHAPKGFVFESGGSNVVKAGLMTRGNLGNSAACVYLYTTGGKGTHLQSRVADALVIHDWFSGGGALDPNWQFFNGKATGGNYLLRPLWMRFKFNVNTWSAFLSLDGNRWTSVGNYQMESVGEWVGLAVTSGQAGKYVTAVFDNVTGFKPNTFVQIGSA